MALVTGRTVRCMAISTPSDVHATDRSSTGDGLTVGDVAAASGVAPSAVRFYEKHGVIEAARTAGNQRRFDRSAICRIEVARVAQRVGLTVRDIAELLSELPTDAGLDDWGRVTDRLITESRQRVAALESLTSGSRLCDLGATHRS